MHTVVTDDPAEAAEFIKKGGTCAFPTETVYGLGANAFDTMAIAKIFEAKRRPTDNPLIAHVFDENQIGQLASEITPSARKLIDSFFPGPLTIVLPKTPAVPMIATVGLATIGIRMPGFPLAHQFLELCGVPVVAPSANISGRPSPTTWQAVFDDLNDRIDCILRGESTEIGLESTVVDCTGSVPILLRAGAISLGDLRHVVRETIPYAGSGAGPARSPGLKHRHYSPRAKVQLVDHGITVNGGNANAFIGLGAAPGSFAITRICSSVDDYARSVFAFFRECDAKNIEVIYCETVPEAGIGAALMDRLKRASAE